MNKTEYCCKNFLELDGYHGGVHYSPSASKPLGYYFVTEHRTRNYSEYTSWDDYEYSSIPMKFCPFCGSDKPGANHLYKE